MSDVDALLRERDGLVARGLKGRVAQVDAVLATMGIGVTDDAPVIEATVPVALENTSQAPVKPRGKK